MAETGNIHTKSKTKSHVWAGLILLLIGVVLLTNKMGFPYPYWFFKWPMILVAVGLFIGLANKFRDFGWLIVTGIGLFFLMDDIFPDFYFGDFLIPAIVIGIALIILLKPRKKREKLPPSETGGPESITIDEPIGSATTSTGEFTRADVLDETAIFGGLKKNVFSKSFRGGEIVCVFGGTEINLTKADFNEPQITIEVVQIFGGTTLIIPPHWQVRSDAVAIFGGFDDKRPQAQVTAPEKILVLSGFAMFGGIEIKSY